jgi:hypothetical protein
MSDMLKHVCMKLTLFLPDSTYETITSLAKLDGVEISQFCSNVLTDFSASERRVERKEYPTNGRLNHLSKNLDESKPDRAIPEMQLIEDIILFLRKKGGSAEKVMVEEAVFGKNKSDFSEPYWNAPVGGGVPRWKKNTQFARNTARKMDLIKTPEDSGRGLWELTEKGWKWKFEM